MGFSGTLVATKVELLYLYLIYSFFFFTRMVPATDFLESEY